MAALPLRALWIGDNPIEFSDGSTLDTDLQTLTVCDYRSAQERR
jgi:hypothetical protein